MSEYNRVYTNSDIILNPNPYLLIQTCFMHYDITDSEMDNIAEIIHNAYSSEETINILFNAHSEGLQLGILKPIDYITTKLEQLGIPRDKFIILSGAVDCPANRQYYKEHCANLGFTELKIQFENVFQARMKAISLRENLSDNKRVIGPKNKKFICFNRNIKFHRLFVTTETIRRGLLDKSYFSMYLNSTAEDHSMIGMRSGIEHYQNWERYLPNLSESSVKIMNDNEHLFPIRLSLQENLSEPHGVRTDLNLFNDSYFGVITESKFFHDSGDIDEMKNELSMNCFFFTEKTYKFIAARMPFVLVGFKDSLKILRDIGYKTFSPYINESYDSIENDEERLVAIMDEVERLSNLSDDEWHELEQNLLPIVNHNFNVLNGNMKTVAMIGLGKLGQDCAEVMAQHYSVVGYDIEPRNPAFPVMPTIADAVKDRDFIFIAAPTPHDPIYGGETPTSHLPNKDFDYTIVKNILEEVNQHVNKNQLVVLISTVLPGTVRNILEPCITNARFIYNPYLIAMGTVKWDMINPEMVIIGTQNGSITGDASELIDFYKVFMQNNPRYEVGTWDEAEAIKIFYNTFISTKLALVNMIQDVAETNGNMNVDVVTNALAKSTHRIMGPAYMKAGLGDAGACHPRDNIALRYLADRLDLGYDLFDSIMTTREVQAERMALRCLKNGKNITIIGKAYKPNVPYTNGSASMLVGHYIEKHGGFVNYYDEHTGDLDLKEDWTDVYLIGYWDEYTKHLRCFSNKQQSVIIDPWREFKEHYKHAGEVIYYGDTRPLENDYSIDEFTEKSITARMYNMLPELKQFSQHIHVIEANVSKDKTFLLRSTESIVESIRDAHKKGKTKIIFYSTYEGLMQPVVNKIHRIAKLVADIIPSHNLICLSGSIDASEMYDRLYNHIQNKITVIGTNFYLHSTQLDTQEFEFIGEYNVMHKAHVFLAFNRVHREHRVKLLDRMLQYDFAKTGYYSFEGEPVDWIDTYADLEKDYPNIYRNKELLPLRLNINEHRNRYSDTQLEDIPFFDHSIFSIVTETSFYDENHKHKFHPTPGAGSMCISEKTYRCFALKHPFILFARPGTLAELRRQGFKTFSPWIDESYDLIENDDERFDAVFKEITRLMAHNHNEDWSNIQNEWKHIMDYNKLHFHRTTNYTKVDVTQYFNDLNGITVTEDPIVHTNSDEVITMPITGDGDRDYRSTTLTSGLKFEYPILLDGGGLEMKDDLVDVIKRTGKEHYNRAFEWCAGFGALGFEVLGSKLTDHMVFSDYFPLALEVCVQVAEDNNLSTQITCHLSSTIKGVPSVEKWDLVIGNPPHSVDRDSLVEYMLMNNDTKNIDNTARLIIDQNWTIHKEFFKNIKSHLHDDADVYIIESQQLEQFVEWAIAGGLKHVGTYPLSALPRGGIYHFKVNT